MPLVNGKSKQAMSQNIETEIEAGKPQKQAVAIAYAQKAKAEKRKKLWTGGEVENENNLSMSDQINKHIHEHTNIPDAPIEGKSLGQALGLRRKK